MTNTQSPYKLGAYYQSTEPSDFPSLYRVSEIHETHTVFEPVGQRAGRSRQVEFHDDTRAWLRPAMVSAVRNAYNRNARHLDELRRDVLDSERKQEELVKALDWAVVDQALRNPEEANETNL